jgi:uncharacterized membrane protein
VTESGRRRWARYVLALFYALAGVGHLVAVDAVVGIVPPWVPQPHLVVIVTGLCELAGAAALLGTRLRSAAGWAFAAYALCVWPANVQHAILDLSRGTGLPIWYHAPRLALQPVIIWWSLWASGAIDWPWRDQPRSSIGGP